MELARLIKAVLLKSKIFNIIPANLFIKIGYFGLMSKFINLKRIEKHDYQKRYTLYREVAEKEALNDEIIFVEFGVGAGHSLRWWLENITCITARFYGFDSFDGLPEPFGKFKKGDMKYPEFKSDDFRLIIKKGIFQDNFFEGWDYNKRMVFHFDADLYSSTMFALMSVGKYLQINDIFIFDEFNVPDHEFKAFCDFTRIFNLKYSIIAERNNFHQVVFKLEGIN